MSDFNNRPLQIKLKQGLVANINSTATVNLAVEGEPHYATDTKQLYIFDGSANIPLPALGQSNTWTGNLVMSGANIDLGTNYLVGEGGSSGLYVDSAGNVGIGTTLTDGKLTIGSSNSYNELVFSAGGLSNIIGKGSGLLIEQQNGDLIFRTRNSGSITIAPDFNTGTGSLYLGTSGNGDTTRVYGQFDIQEGNVGIGTTAPGGKLHINGTADDQQLIIEGHSTQTANLTEWHNSSGNLLSYINPTGGALFSDKVSFTQTDGNEAIDSLADGYMDYLATTQHRFNNDVDVTGNVEADTYSVSGTSGADASFSILDGDGVTSHDFVFTKGILTSYGTS